ncbi:hypothetical protein [Paenibacillus oryzisoli]|uniref:hypothetical protein n=1 Tax=Paenibacillus oryzisoli TaxID=1850517 RepID=UPI001428BC4E|nr:hypothetical protein [Paenibacillus oryzisoli]
MAMTMASVTSASGRHCGVLIMSDDPNIIKNSLALTEAFKSVTKGGGLNERVVDIKDHRRSS